MGCIYCEDTAKRETISMPICDLKVSRAFLLFDQTFPGRCAVAFKDHKTEVFQLTEEERKDFFDDVALVAKAISQLYHADKVEYAIFGDKMPHLHVHLAVKRAEDEDFGTPYNQTKRDKVVFSESEMAQRIDEIKEKLESLKEEIK